jgi:hypothetical protein
MEGTPMKNRNSDVSLGFTKAPYPAGTHMCLIYHDDQARRQIIGRFIDAGLGAGEKVAYFPETLSPGDIETFLDLMGITIAGHLHDNLSLSDAETTYCPRGVFMPEEMLQTLRSFYTDTVAAGYPGCRVSGEMDWALKDIPGADRLMEYEAQVNELVKTHPVTAICQYDANRFDGATILQCLEVHPYLIANGQIIHNPFYKTPAALARFTDHGD